METIRLFMNRIWRRIIIRTDALLLRNPYSRCKYIAIERSGECLFIAELLSRSFETLCQELSIEIPSYQNGLTAGRFCQWYMSLRLSWVTAQSIMVGNSLHPFNDLPAPRPLSLAKDSIDRNLAAAKFWSFYLLEAKDGASIKIPIGLKATKTDVNRSILQSKPHRKKLSIDFSAVAHELQKNAETLEIINRHFAPEEYE